MDILHLAAPCRNVPVTFTLDMADARIRGSSRKWKIGSLLLVVATVVAYCAYEPTIPFDRETWRNGERWSSSDSIAPRILMAEGLVRERALLGKRRAEIEEMLGPPSEAGYFRAYDLVYWLGPERGFMSIDSEWLVVRLDASGAATEAKIVSD